MPPLPSRNTGREGRRRRGGMGWRFSSPKKGGEEKEGQDGMALLHPEEDR
jgi:hypothetical protein